MSKEISIKVLNLSKKYNLYRHRKDRLKEALHPFRKKYHTDFWALRRVNLEVTRGEIMGVVGRNGSGKSTLLKAVAGVTVPTEGHVTIQGRVVPLLELGSGFNPEFTGMENIFFYGSINGYDRRATTAMVEEIVSFADIGEHIYQPIKTYSSGMKARLAFAVSTTISPDILILDEVLSVGDELFKRKCYARMEKLMGDGVTVIFVSHSLDSVNQLCREAILLEKGELLLRGPSKMVTMLYQKMLYATPDNKDAVLSEIRGFQSRGHAGTSSGSGGTVEAEHVHEIAGNTDSREEGATPKTAGEEIVSSAPGAYLVEHFVPKSTVEYKNAPVDILDIQIRTPEGRQVNHLQSGEAYVFQYRVRFGLDVEGAVFGMKIKTDKGVLLMGTNSGKLSENPIAASHGSEYLVKFAFQNNLLAGTYYLNAGVSCFDQGAIVFLNRIEDALCFKVLLEKNMLSGMVSMDVALEIERCREALETSPGTREGIP